MSQLSGDLLALGAVGVLAVASMVPRRGSARAGIVSTGSRADVNAVWYHLTNRARFKLDPKFEPEDASLSIEDRSGRPGIYLGSSVEKWVNGFGYWRPFVVEFKVDPSVKDDPGVHGRWGGEMFVPASSFDKLTIQRVIPLDAHAREKFGEYGWIERWHEREFDTGKPIKRRGWDEPLIHPFPDSYRYAGPDVRNMSLADTGRLRRQLRQAKADFFA